MSGGSICRSASRVTPLRTRWVDPEQLRRQVRILQIAIPLYAIYRLLSRDYAVYVLAGPEFSQFTRPVTNQYPTLLLDLITGQLFFRNIYWPSPAEIMTFVGITVFALILLLLGVSPRFTAITSALGLTILHGFMQATNAEIDGGTITVFALIWMGFQPRLVLRSVDWSRNSSASESAAGSRNFLFGYQLLVATFYFYSGLNKFIDIGPQWILTLHLDRLAEQRLYEIAFVNSRFGESWLLEVLTWYPLSVAAALGTLAGELGLLIALIVAPRYIVLPILLLIAMHTLILLATGINFIGNSVLLLLMLPLTRSHQCLEPAQVRSD